MSFECAVPCVICDRLVYGTRITCSDVCRDVWLGELGAVR